MWKYTFKPQVKQLLVDCGAEELVPVFAKKKVIVIVAVSRFFCSHECNFVFLSLGDCFTGTSSNVCHHHQKEMKREFSLTFFKVCTDLSKITCHPCHCPTSV